MSHREPHWDCSGTVSDVDTFTLHTGREEIVFLRATPERLAATELLEACKAVRALRRQGIATAPIRETNLLVDRAIAKAEGREP